MSNGHYFAEAYGAKIRWRNDPGEWSGEFLEYPVKTPEDLAALPVLDPDENPVFPREIEIAKGVCEHYRGEVPVLATIFTPLTWMQEMMHSCNPCAGYADDGGTSKRSAQGAGSAAGNQ